MRLSAQHNVPFSRWAFVSFSALLLSACGRDDVARSSQSRPWDYRYEYDHRICFGYGGDAERHTVRGWSEIEPNHTWTNATSATLGFRVLRSEVPVTLKVTTGAMTNPPELTSQPVDVYVQNEKVASWNVAEFKTYTAEIPRRFTSVPETQFIVRFDIPHAVSPAELGQSGDLRKLGLLVSEVVLSKTQPAPLNPERAYGYGDKVSFGSGGNGGRYCVNGWSNPEPGCTWTDGSLASLSFTLPSSTGPVILLLKAGGMHGEVRAPSEHASVPSQRVQVSVRGQTIAEWEVTEETLHAAVIPGDLVPSPTNAVAIDFALPDATSPAEMGHGGDARKLGLRVSAAAIIEQPEALRQNQSAVATP